jgi:hypothetical protein
MPIYELCNPSDPYTFEAPNIQIAGLCAAFLSTSFGAKQVDADVQSPVLFGWDHWFKEQGMLGEDGELTGYIKAHAKEIADAYDSFLIGSVSDRQDVVEMLKLIPEDKREKWRAERQDRHRSSMSKIGERAYQLARQMRERIPEASPA